MRYCTRYSLRRVQHQHAELRGLPFVGNLWRICGAARDAQTREGVHDILVPRINVPRTTR
jgi:hypothetical protein